MRLVQMINKIVMTHNKNHAASNTEYIDKQGILKEYGISYLELF